MKAKKVELTELFYDLVFVYAISQMTGLIHHLHHGVIAYTSFMSFIACLIVLVNTWMIQTVYTNRYGENSFVNIAFMMSSMAMVLGLSNTFTDDWSDPTNFFVYWSYVIGLTVLLLAQYIYEFMRNKGKNRRIPALFIKVLSARTFLLLGSVMLAAFTSQVVGFWAALISVVLTTLAPILFRDDMADQTTNFPHLVERLSLLVIITFGEMLIGVAPYFARGVIGWNSLLVFLLAGFLFLFYIVEIDHLIDHHRQKENGYTLIYWHYPIFLGLSFITVSLGFFREKVNPLFLVAFLYTGLILFYAGVYAQRVYNRAEARYPRSFVLSQLAIFLVALAVSLLLQENLFAVLLVTTVMVIILSVRYVRFTIAKLY